MELSIALSGLLLSFFFAGSEAAYMAFNNLRLELWERRGLPLAHTARQFTDRPENFYSTILLGNNLANITYSTFATVLLIRYMDETVAWMCITFVVLFFGEIFPKVLFQSFANRIILNLLLLVRMFYILGYPLIKLLNKVISLIYFFLRMPDLSFQSLFSRDELRIMLEEEGDSNDNFRQRYIANILEFSSARVTEAMTPRTEIIAVPENATWEELLDVMISSGKHHIPVFRETLDNIIGLIFLFDMLDPADTIDHLIKPVHYVPETKNCPELLRELQAANSTIAVVIDEYGGTEGIVTTDDLVEIVFGEFLEPYETPPAVKALNDRTWLIDARVDLDELEGMINISFPEGDYETLAGFIIDQMGQIPKVKDILVFEDYRIEIAEASPKKVYKVKLIRQVKE